MVPKLIPGAFPAALKRVPPAELRSPLVARTKPKPKPGTKSTPKFGFYPRSWSSSPATDMMSYLECASQGFDDCISWCAEANQNEQGSYCRKDCTDRYKCGSAGR